MSGLHDSEVINFCNNFPFLMLICGFEFFKFFIKSMVSCGRYIADENPLIKILEADVGYCELQALCETLLLFQ